MRKTKHTGFAIALAWPSTYCKQPGSWYDPLTLWMGINKNHYYRVGHAAVVLIDSAGNKCHYFDFGRYHAPFQHGRVRGAETDHELAMQTTPVISADGSRVENFEEILREMQHNTACHGEGDLHASICRVDFHAALNKANYLQQKGSIPYGPFRLRGSNCSRFVNTVIRAGKPDWRYLKRLKYLRVITPTPLNNVNSLGEKSVIPANPRIMPFEPLHRLDRKKLRRPLLKPERHLPIPVDAQWLSGEGAGSWFDIQLQDSRLRVTRYSPDGTIECEGLFENHSESENPSDPPHQITYPSDCNKITLKDSSQQIQFRRVPD